VAREGGPDGDLEKACGSIREKTDGALPSEATLPESVDQNTQAIMARASIVEAFDLQRKLLLFHLRHHTVDCDQFALCFRLHAT